MKLLWNAMRKSFRFLCNSHRNLNLKPVKQKCIYFYWNTENKTVVRTYSFIQTEYISSYTEHKLTKIRKGYWNLTEAYTSVWVFVGEILNLKSSIRERECVCECVKDWTLKCFQVIQKTKQTAGIKNCVKSVIMRFKIPSHVLTISITHEMCHLIKKNVNLI